MAASLATLGTIHHNDHLKPVHHKYAQGKTYIFISFFNAATSFVFSSCVVNEA